MVVLSVIWGLAFPAIRSADFYLSPLSIVILRWSIASVGFCALLPVAKWKTRFVAKDLPRLVVFALMSVALYGLLLNTAETSISSGLAGLIVSLGPVFMMVFSAIALKERVHKRLLVALLLAVLGSALLSVADLSVRGASLLGAIEALAAALVYAGFTVVSKPLVERYGSLPVTIWGSLVGTALLLPLVSTDFLRQVASLPLDGWLSVVYLSVFSTVVGYSLFYNLVGRVPLSALSVQLYLVPIVSVVGGVLILSEQVTPLVALGGAVTLLAIAMARTKNA